MIRFKKCVIVLAGPPLHGKSTVASLLAAKSNLNWLDIDAIKSKHFPGATAEQLQITEAAYQLMIQDAQVILSGGKPVILSATFSRDEFKAPLYRLLELVEYKVFYLKIQSLDCIRSRIENRNSKEKNHPIQSLNQYQWSLGLWRPWKKVIEIVEVNSDQQIDLITDVILDQCRDLIVRG